MATVVFEMEARMELRPTHVAWVPFHLSISETEWLSHPRRKRFIESTSTQRDNS